MKAISTRFLLPMLARRKRLNVTEAGELVICSHVGQVLARHRLLLGKQERSVQAEHYRGLGLAVPRVERATAVQESSQASTSMLWDAPVVEVRPLSVYDQLLWEVS